MHTLGDWCIGQVLREHYRDLRFRSEFLNHPFLSDWTVKAVLSSQRSFDAFFDACRALPQFGRVQEARLFSVLMDLQDRLGLLPNDFSRDAYQCRKLNRASGLAESFGLGDAAPVTLTGEFYPDYLSAWSAVYQRAWRLAHFDDFVYIPTSLPEFAKHPDVLRAEIGGDDDLKKYLEDNASLRQSLSSLKSSTGLILIDRMRLDPILRREGPYVCLSEEAVTAQRQMLFDLLAELPAGFQARVCDLELARLSPGSVVGELIILSAMGGYLVTQSNRFRAAILERCRNLFDQSTTLSHYVAKAVCD